MRVFKNSNYRDVSDNQLTTIPRQFKISESFAPEHISCFFGVDNF